MLYRCVKICPLFSPPFVKRTTVASDRRHRVPESPQPLGVLYPPSIRKGESHEGSVSADGELGRLSCARSAPREMMNCAAFLSRVLQCRRGVDGHVSAALYNGAAEQRSPSKANTSAALAWVPASNRGISALEKPLIFLDTLTGCKQRKHGSNSPPRLPFSHPPRRWAISPGIGGALRRDDGQHPANALVHIGPELLPCQSREGGQGLRSRCGGGPKVYGLSPLFHSSASILGGGRCHPSRNLPSQVSLISHSLIYIILDF